MTKRKITVKKNIISKFSKIPSLKSLYSSGDIEEHTIESMLSVDGSIDKDKIDSLYLDSLIQQAVDTPVNDSIGNGINSGDFSSKLFSDLQFMLPSAGINARKYGTAMIIPVIATKDGRSTSLKKPLSEIMESIEKYKLLKFVEVMNFGISSEIETSIYSDNYGNPAYYTVGDDKIHASRAMIVRSNSAGNSFLLSILYYWSSFRERNNSVTQAVKESNWIIFKMDLPMLVEMAQASIEAGNSGDIESIVGDLIKDRLADLRLNANNNDAYGIDKNSEDIMEISKRNINQLSESARDAANLLVSAVDIPKTRYLGDQAGGLGNNGDDLVYIQSLYGLRSFLFNNLVQKTVDIISAFEGIAPFKWKWEKTAIEIMQCKDCGDSNGL